MLIGVIIENHVNNIFSVLSYFLFSLFLSRMNVVLALYNKSSSRHKKRFIKGKLYIIYVFIILIFIILLYILHYSLIQEIYNLETKLTFNWNLKTEYIVIREIQLLSYYFMESPSVQSWCVLRWSGEYPEVFPLFACLQQPSLKTIEPFFMFARDCY